MVDVTQEQCLLEMAKIPLNGPAKVTWTCGLRADSVSSLGNVKVGVTSGIGSSIIV